MSGDINKFEFQCYGDIVLGDFSFKDQDRSIVLKVDLLDLLKVRDSLGHDETVSGIDVDEKYHVYKIYHKNIRYYRGSGTITNNRLKSTFESILSGKPTYVNKDSFSIFNNGLTVFADEVNYSNGKLVIQNPSIINGQQTLETYAHTVEDSSYDGCDKSIYVQVKFFTLSNKDDTIEKVVFSSNRQNEISASELRSTSQYAVDIAKELAGNGVQFRLKKGSDNTTGFFVSLDRIFNLIKTVDSEKQKPEIAKRYEKADDFFNDDYMYEQYFGKLAKKLNGGDGSAAKRLGHLVFVNEVKLATGKFKIIKQLFQELGVNGATLGRDTKGSESRKQFVIALWPKVKAEIILGLLRKKDWHLNDDRLSSYAVVDNGSISNHIKFLIAASQLRLPSDYVTNDFKAYTEWVQNLDEDEDGSAEAFLADVHVNPEETTPNLIQSL